MREWNFTTNDPLSLTLAADARLGPTNYIDDQIWEITLSGGEPPALAMQTTYGLRARSLRMFPRYTEGETVGVDPAAFHGAPVVTRLFPNFLTIAYAPLPDIDVEADYWVPQSQGAAGRLHLVNRSSRPRQIRLEWIGVLTPNEGQRMAAAEIQAATVLAGQTGDLAPVIFLTGGSEAGVGAYPSLALTIDLPAGGSYSAAWAHAALANPEESFALARSLTARKWEAERARLELLNAGQVEIYTGDPDWDAAFYLAQKAAYGLLVGPTPSLPFPSFVASRQPDQGYSFRGDGSDYNHLWNGQTPLGAWHLSSLILPSAPDLVEGFLRNFLSVQAEDGFIDWKPGLAGQRSRLQATPLLASLAWRIYEVNQNPAFLEEVFDGLLRYTRAWFAPERDRDGDGVPEWDHPMQAGAEDHPLFSRWHDWSLGVEISTAECPSLCSFLYRECQALARMAELLGRDEAVQELQSAAGHLKTAVESSWVAEEASYHDWDRDTHHTLQSEWLGQRQGPGEVVIDRSFEYPVRLLVQFHTSGETTRRPQIFVHGVNTSGNHRVEHISDSRIRWYLGKGTLTGERVYAAIEHVEVQDIAPNDQVTILTAGYHHQEQSLLLPLWAGIPDEERARCLVEKTITSPSVYWRPYGLPVCPGSAETSSEEPHRSVHLPWNALVAEGLLGYGFRREAAELFTRMMAGVLDSLKRERAFRRAYHADSGQGAGERNALEGLPPLGLFLDVLGLRLISPQRVALAGFNPFPWPVTVKYRGMTILRQKEKTMVIFPDGQTVVVDDPSPRIVSLEMGHA